MGVSATGVIALAANPSRRASHQMSPERVIDPERMTAAGSVQLTSDAVASPRAYAERAKHEAARAFPPSASSCRARPPSTAGSDSPRNESYQAVMPEPEQKDSMCPLRPHEHTMSGA